MRFKVGERVVRVGVQSGKHFPSYRGVVVEVKKNGRILVEWDFAGITGNKPEHIIYEHIYDSPLYKALT